MDFTDVIQGRCSLEKAAAAHKTDDLYIVIICKYCGVVAFLRKYFTVEETVTETKDESGNVTGTLKEKVISLWTGFLGIFHITNDAFEGSENADGSKDTYSDLSDAAAGNSGKAVDMLRDYETDKSAVLDNDVNVDLNGHTYTNTRL